MPPYEANQCGYENNYRSLGPVNLLRPGLSALASVDVPRRALELARQHRLVLAHLLGWHLRLLLVKRTPGPLKCLSCSNRLSARCAPRCSNPPAGKACTPASIPPSARSAAANTFYGSLMSHTHCENGKVRHFPDSSKSGIIPSTRLRLLEQVIERGLTTFVEVGNALLEIRDSRLYKDSFSTFEDYCRERWGMSRPRAYPLIEAAEIMSNLSTIRRHADA